MATDFHVVHSSTRRYDADGIIAGAREALIGDNVFIGAGAFVLKGVTIGENTVIGAGAVVTAKVPANAIVGGNPAQVIGQARIRDGDERTPAAMASAVYHAPAPSRGPQSS
jgi:acetyltransferase-like isoleucine patch superfamily enzyme